MSSMISDAIAAYERETESLKWWSHRRYEPTASKTLPVINVPSDWLLTYRLQGEVVRGGHTTYRVPSPEDIEYACECINAERNRDAILERHDEPNVIKEYRVPRITVRYMPSEYESQLCDCPYWGTEFS